MNTTTTTQRLINRLIFVFMISAFATTTWATTLTWNGPVGGNWDTATSNWLDGATPTNWSNANPDSAIFGSTGAGTINLTEGITALALTFNTTGYTLTGNTLTLSPGAVITNAGAATTINSILAGTGGMVKAGTGTLTLGGNNTFSGGLTIRGGTVKMGNAGALNSTTPNAVTLGLTGDTDATLDANGQSFNMASLTVGGTGSKIRSNAWGGPRVTPGNTTLDSALIIERYGDNTHEGFQNVGKITGNGAGSGNVSFIFQRTGNNNFYWQADNTVANDFLGNIQVKGGELRHQGSGAVNNTVIPDTAMLIIDSSAAWSWNNSGTVTETLDGLASGNLGSGNGGRMYRNIPQYTLTINANNADNEGKRIYEGTIESMSGTLTLGGTGTQEFRGANANFANATALNNGTLKLTKTTAWASGITMGAANTPKVQLNAPLAADSWTFSKIIAGGSVNATVEKVGSGTVALSESQTYTGNTAVSDGKLLMQMSGAVTNPYAISGMIFWVDAGDPNGNGTVPANGTAITNWVNKASGGAANLTVSGSGATPAYTAANAAFNNKPTVTFFAGKELSNSYNFGTTLSVIYVGRIGATKQRLVSGNGVNWILGYWSNNMNVNYWNGGSLGSAADTNPHIWINGATGGANMLGYRYDAAGETALGNGTGGAGPTGGLRLGGGWNTSELSDGDIAELLVFNRQLTSAERTLVETYLYNKYFNASATIITIPAGGIAGSVSVAANATFGGAGVASNITVQSGGALQGGYNGSGTLTAADVTLGSIAADITTLKGTVSTNSDYKPIAVTSLAINGGDGKVILEASGMGLTSGTYYDLLVSASAITAPNASSVLAALKSNSRAYTPNVDGTGTKIQLYYDAAASVYWTGATGTAWNTADTNWKLNGNNADTQFMPGDIVFFNDSPASTTVDISSGDVSPISTTFSNTTSYTLQGANGISGGTINKNGNGTVTISNVNNTAGAVALNAGLVSMSQSGGLGTGALTFNGGSLEYTGTAGSWSRTVDVTANGGTVCVADGTSLTSGGALTGAGALTKSGPGTLVLGGNGTYAGAVTVSGTLVANHANALGTGGSTVVLGDSGTGANPVEFRADSAITSKVRLAAITNSNYGTSQTITINGGSALPQNDAGIETTLNLAGTVPVTLKATHTAPNHITPQDMNWRIQGTSIPTGTTALILDGTTYPLRTSQLSNSSPASDFTGDVLIKGNVITQGRTYSGNTAGNQNLNFTNNDVTVDTAATWSIVWGGETCGALKGTGAITLNCQSALNNTGLTMGNNNRNGSYSGAIGGGWGVAKVGSGTQTLAGNNTYSGTTAVNDGTLLVNGRNSGTGAFSVTPGATLGGTGSINGAATFNTGAKAVFTLTLDPITKTNTTAITIAGVMTFNATEVHVNAPVNLKPGKYVLARSSAVPAGTFTTPVLDTGSYHFASSSPEVYLEIDNTLMLWIKPGNTIISFF